LPDEDLGVRTVLEVRKFASYGGAADILPVTTSYFSGLTERKQAVACTLLNDRFHGLFTPFA